MIFNVRDDEVEDEIHQKRKEEKIDYNYVQLYLTVMSQLAGNL